MHLERNYRLRIAQVAGALYATLTAEERTVVRFGMLPAGKTQAAEEALVREIEQAEGQKLTPRDLCDLSRLLAVAVMAAANRGPDKMIV